MKESNAIAKQTKAEGDSLQESTMDKDTDNAKGGHSLHSSDYDMKVACFIGIKPCLDKKRVWHERWPTFPDFDEFGKDWTEHQEELARHKVWKLHKRKKNKLGKKDLLVFQTAHGIVRSTEEEKVYLLQAGQLCEDGERFSLGVVFGTTLRRGGLVSLVATRRTYQSNER